MRQSFKPYQQVVEVLREDPGASQKAIVARAKSAVVQADTQVHFEQCSRRVVQGQTMRQFQDRAAELWAHVVTSLPESTMRFALNSVTDTLPHNANLHLWGKKTFTNLPAVSRATNPSACAQPLQHCPGEEALQQEARRHLGLTVFLCQ